MVRCFKHFLKPSLARQEFKAECDLFQVIKRFSSTSEGLRALQSAQGVIEGAEYYDVSGVPDYRTARDIVNEAGERFMALPALLRKRFDNDPAKFLDFALDPVNLDEMRRLGLAAPLKEQPVQDQSSGVSG